MSDLFLFLDTVEASEGVGELFFFGEEVPNFKKFGLDSPLGLVNPVVVSLELCCKGTRLGLDSASRGSGGVDIASVLSTLEV